MMRIFPIFALCLLLPLGAAAQDQAGSFNNVFSQGSWSGQPRAAAPTSAMREPPQTGSGWQGRSQTEGPQQQRPRNTTTSPYGQGSGMPQQQAPSRPMYAATPQPLVLPTEDTDRADKTVYRPAVPDEELDLPPQLNRMIKDYETALRKLNPEQIAYVENVVQEGYKLDEPLHEALIKSMDWNICYRSSFTPSFSKKHYLKFRENEEKVYLENKAAFETGVLSQVNFMDQNIIKGKITAQGVMSMTAMKKLYLLEASKASPQKIEQDCEMLVKYLTDYTRRNIF